MTLIPPWKWIRHKIGNTWFCTLETTAPASQCIAQDTMILPMREDCAQFPYAGKLPVHRMIEATPELINLVNDFLQWGRDHTSPNDAHSPHDILVRAFETLERIGALGEQT